MSFLHPTEEEILAKEKLIKSEKRKLRSLLKDLPPEKKRAAEGLTDECAFMRATLNQLRQYIDETGIIDEMEQGDYTILREHPALKTYNNMAPKYAAVCKQLFDMLPTKTPTPDDDFDDFVKRKK